MIWSDVFDRGLSPTRTRIARLFSFWYSGGYLAEYLLHLREWLDEETMIEHVYAVQNLPGEESRLGTVFAFIRVNPIPTVGTEYDDGEDAHERLFTCFVPYEKTARPVCDCKGYRTFRRCRHGECLGSMRFPSIDPDEWTAEENESWIIAK